MGRQALLTVACLLAVSATYGDPEELKSSSITDNVSAESAPRLYRNVPFGVYASAAPYRAYSIQIPSFVNAPKPAASRIIPVTEVFQNSGYLKDSYGNRFVESPQSLGYKTTFPQQFVQLQALPAHLSQPIVAAPPSQQHRQSAPFVLGPHYTYPLQSSSPQRFGVAQPLVYAGTVKTLLPSGPFSPQVQHHKGQQQTTSSQLVYTNSQPQEQYNKVKEVAKFERLQEAPKDEKQGPVTTQQATHHDKAQLQAAPEETAITTVVNGKKTVIHLKTKPPLPLLDLNLLEPLTFDNPLVPQVQHFLPRINQANYHKLPKPNLNDAKSYQKEFVVMKTKSYDSGLIKGKPQKGAPKKKQKRPAPENHNLHENEESPKQKVVITGNPNGNPEISYEINSPNYKETYKEQAISYNKETQSEPVHFTYGSNVEKAPVEYSYTHNSKQPIETKEVHYRNGAGPTQLIYTFKPEEQNREQDETSVRAPHESHVHSGEHAETENGGYTNNYRPQEHHEHQERHEEVKNTRTSKPEYREINNYHPQKHHDNQERHEEVKNTHATKPEYREILYHEVPSHGHEHQKTVHHQSHPQLQFQGHPINVQGAEPFHPVTHYEEHIRVVPNHKTGRINVDPSQHVHKGQIVPQQHAHPSPAPRHPPQPSPAPHHHPQNHPAAPPRPYHPPPQHVQEKSRRVIIQEETPEEMHTLREQMSAEMIDQEENNEEDFEKAYKNAAFGFPAYDKDPVDIEKDIYSADSYGVPRDENEYDIEHSPFQQYQEQGNEFPKTTRLNYKDERDKTKEDYYLDYSVSKPESLTDRYNNKVEYYKLYKKQKPEYYGDDDKKQNQNAKYTAAPFIFNGGQAKPKQAFTQFRAAPNTFEFDYSKKDSRDNSAYATIPLQRYRTKTNFVEPQFQYGFEPVSLPRLLDSELAAMASNNSPESEKPGLRKKLYKENWYIKKTSTSGGQPDS